MLIKRALRWVAVVLGLVGAAAGGFAAFVAIRGIPRYTPGNIQLKVDATPQRLARGEKLVRLLCAECHLDPVTRQLTGRRMIDVPPEFGPIVSKNITRDREKGIGGWTDGELAYLVRTGISRDGSYIPPYMAKLPHLADEDLASIIAFLRSDHPLTAPAAVDPPGRTRPSFLTKFLSRVAFGPLPYPTRPISAPAPDDKVAYGRYLVFNLECWTCHSADFKTMNVLEPEKTPGFLGGGNPMRDLGGRVVPTANLTPDEQTGIGRWSEADFARVLRRGVRPDGRPILYPMTPMPELSTDDLSAIYAYLRTVPKIANAVARAQPPVQLGGSPGKLLYYRYGCYGCHGDAGLGIADLRKGGEHYPTDEGLIAWIKNAPAIKPGTRMPQWEGVIPEAEFPVLAAYVRELGAKAKTP